MDGNINLSEVIANGDVYSLEAPICHYEELARKIQAKLDEQVQLTPYYDTEEEKYWLTDRIALESVLISQNDEEIVICNSKMYVAHHSTGDDPTIGYPYYGSISPSFAVLADGCEMGRSADPVSVVKMALDAIICMIAAPKITKRRVNPSLN